MQYIIDERQLLALDWTKVKITSEECLLKPGSAEAGNERYLSITPPKRKVKNAVKVFLGNPVKHL